MYWAPACAGATAFPTFSETIKLLQREKFGFTRSPGYTHPLSLQASATLATETR
jgi:hypothetical protein